MPRQMLTDEYWAKLRPAMLGLGIYAKPQLRQTIEGILYRLRVGCPWRDLPEVFGGWNAVYKRFNDWSRKEKLMAIFNALVVGQTLNGNSLMEASSRRTSTAVVLPEGKKPPSGSQWQETPPRSIWLLMLVACLFISG